MNVIKGITQTAQIPKQLSSKWKDRHEEFQRQEQVMIDEICDYIEKATKTEKYINMTLNRFENVDFEIHLDLNAMNIMLQCLEHERIYNTKSYLLGYEGESTCYERYNIKRLDNFIDLTEEQLLFLQDKDEEERGNSALDEYYAFYMTLGYKDDKKSIHTIQVTKIEYEYISSIEEPGYRFRLDHRFERAIRAINDMYLANSEKIKAILDKKIEECDY